MVSNERILEIMNIQRSAVGIYTCVATHPLSGATMNSTVNVIVQCKCQCSMDILYIYTNKMCVEEVLRHRKVYIFYIMVYIMLVHIHFMSSLSIIIMLSHNPLATM